MLSRGQREEEVADGKVNYGLMLENSQTWANTINALCMYDILHVKRTEYTLFIF